MESDCFHRLIQLMKNDKKNSGKQINFSLISNIGEAVYDQPVEIDSIVQSLQFYQEKISLMPKVK
jgi:3-dehydroquinate synthase